MLPSSKRVRLLSGQYASADASQNAGPDNDINNDNDCASTLLEVQFPVDFMTKGSLLTTSPLPLLPAQAHSPPPGVGIDPLDKDSPRT